MKIVDLNGGRDLARGHQRGEGSKFDNGPIATTQCLEAISDRNNSVARQIQEQRYFHLDSIFIRSLPAHLHLTGPISQQSASAHPPAQTQATSPAPAQATTSASGPGDSETARTHASGTFYHPPAAVVVVARPSQRCPRSRRYWRPGNELPQRHLTPGPTTPTVNADRAIPTTGTAAGDSPPTPGPATRGCGCSAGA